MEKFFKQPEVFAGWPLEVMVEEMDRHGVRRAILSAIGEDGHAVASNASDYPVFSFGRGTAELHALEMNPTARHKFLYVNAARVFQLDP